MNNRIGIIAIVVTLAVFTTSAHAAGTKDAPADTAMTLPGGSEGKNLDSITVEGEDRVRVQFQRPPLELKLDPASAPGLDWESLWTVLAPESFDFTGPLLARSAYDRAWYTPEPWLSEFRTGPVARFRPQVTDVENWSFDIADSRGGKVAHFDGSGKPPKEIAWDGVASDGSMARSDLTYSYVLNAMDKAGNKRSFVGDSFEIPPHLDQNGSDVRMSFAVSVNEATVPENYVREAASRINESGDAARAVKVEVTAPTFALSKSIAEDVATALRPLLRGEGTRVAMSTQVDAGGGDKASVVIVTGGAARAAAPASGKR